MEFVDEVEINDLLLIDQSSFSSHDAWNQATFERFLNNPYVQLLAAKVDDQVAGYMIVFKMIDTMEILSLAVLPKYQRQKIASQLIEQMVKINHKYKKIFLEVRVSNQPAIETYQKNNFKIIYQRVDYYSQPTENALIMERQIE